MVLCPGTPEGSTGSGSGFKGDNGLKSHPTDWEKPGIEPATAGTSLIVKTLTKHYTNLECFFLHDIQVTYILNK